jgi:hypothetical protein
MASSRGVRADDLDARAVDMSDAAAECRMLRHAWPRKRDPNYAGLVSVTVAARNRAGQPTVIERVMSCAAGCGTVKTLTLAVDPRTGRAERTSASYRYAEGYLLKPGNDEKGSHVDAHELQYMLLRRIYPDLRW